MMAGYTLAQWHSRGNTRPTDNVVADRDDPSQVNALETFLDRPKHFDDGLVIQANEQLAYLLTASEHPNLDRLYKAVVSQDGDDPEGISVLAEHKVHLPELELIVSNELGASASPFSADPASSANL
jgi:hypothetical protein